MAFKLVRAFVVLLFASLASCLPPSAEVTRDQLRDHTVPPLNTQSWEDVVRTFMEGKGSLIGRDESTASELAAQRNLGPASVAQAIKRSTGWRDLGTDTSKKIWDNEVLRNEAHYIKFIENPYPYLLPPGVEHWIMWLRCSFIDESVFDDFEPGRPILPKILVEYIKAYDFFGSYGIRNDLGEYRQGLFQHPTDEDYWWSKINPDEYVEHALGNRIRQHAAAKINAVLQRKFPADQYQVVWNASPDHYKSVLKPEHIHTLVYRI